MSNQFNFPTVIISGENALAAFADALKKTGHKHMLIVTDTMLVKLGICQQVLDALKDTGIQFTVFDGAEPNPVEANVEAGAEAYTEAGCDGLIALGGGSPMDVAKTIKIAVSHPSPLAQYDDALGGDALLVNPMPACYAIPTTAGTGSEVGRCSVIIMRDSGLKTLFFHPTLLPPIAVLDPLLTVGLPPHITAATGIDAYTHCLEAYFVSAFHPMADAIAVEGMKLILENLRVAVLTGTDLPAREKMQVAAAMGATAFQKGLGMIHSLAHPLSTQFNTHHGLANALLLPASLRFLEAAELTDEQKNKFNTANDLFKGSSFHSEKLSESCTAFFESLGIEFGLSNHGIADKDLTGLAKEAIGDPCHATNMVVISEADLLATYTDAL